MEPAILIHGGVTQPSSHSDGTLEAAKAAMEILNGGGDAREAVLKAVVMLENDERFNAGTGSRLRLDGSLEMDAVVQDSRGFFGAVAAIRGVKNPVLVAEKVGLSPHKVMAGEGATKFARRYGFSHYDPSTRKNVERLGRYKKKIEAGEVPEWLGDFKAYKDMIKDTVGAMAVDRRNVFAAASSTGGANIMLPGRVGDTPMIGCGQFVGKDGAVLSTGVGEFIIEKMLSHSVYTKMDGEMGAKEAADWGVALYPKEIPIGVLTISKNGWGISANQYMACTVMTWDTTLNGSDIWPPEGHEEDDTYIPPEAQQEPEGQAQQSMPDAPPPQFMPPEGPRPQQTQAAAPPPTVASQPVQAPNEGRAEADRAVHELIEPTPATQPPPMSHPSPAPPPVTQPPPAPKPQKFRCPYCQNIFATVITTKPVTVPCPYCRQSTLIQ